MSARWMFCNSILLLVVAGCGSAIATGHSGTPAGAPAAAAKDQASADDLYTTIAGTPSQRDAGDRVAYDIEQQPQADCVTTSGVSEYSPVALVGHWANWPSTGASTFSTDWLAPLNEPGHLAALVQNEARAQRGTAAANTAMDKVYENLSDTERAAWDQALESCPQGTGYVDAWHPAQYYSLLFAYHSTVDQVDAQLGQGYGDGYAKCMSTAGYPGVANFSELTSLLEGKLPPQDEIPDPGDSGTDAWNAWLALDEAASAADGACRAAAYADGWAILGPGLTAFASGHANELADEEAGWIALVDRSGGN